MRGLTRVLGALVILGASFGFTAAHADEIKTKLLIESSHPDGTLFMKHVEAVSSTPEEAADIVTHFSAEVTEASEPDEDFVVSVAKFNEASGSYETIAQR